MKITAIAAATLALTVGMSGAAFAAPANKPQPPVAQVDKSLAYLYMKLDVNKRAAFENSGVQNLVAERLGTKFFNVSDVKLPADICGTGWALQLDIIKYKEGSFVVPSTFSFPATPFSSAGVLVKAKHVDLKLAECPVEEPPVDVTVVPAQPADRTVRTTLYSDIECVDGWVEDVVQVETFGTRYDVASNVWVEYSAGVSEVRENNRPATVAECDLVITLPVMPPEDVPGDGVVAPISDSDDVVDEIGEFPAVVEVPAVVEAIVELPAVVQAIVELPAVVELPLVVEAIVEPVMPVPVVAVSQPPVLAMTGGNDSVGFVSLLALMLTVLGAGMVAVRRTLTERNQ